MPRGSSTDPARTTRRPRLLPAVSALILCIGGVAGNIVATELDWVRTSHLWVVWLAFGIALCMAIFLAIRDHPQYEQETAVPTEHQAHGQHASAASGLAPDQHRSFLVVASLLSVALMLGLEQLNRSVFHFAVLHPSIANVAVIATAIMACLAFLPWLRPVGKPYGALAGMLGLVGFYSLKHILVSGGNEELHWKALEWLLPLFYGLMFGAPAWTLKALLMSKIFPSGMQVGRTKFMGPREGLHEVSVSRNTKCNIVFIHGVHGDYFKTWCVDYQQENYWPAWVADQFPDTAVYALQYTAFVTRWKGGTMPLFDRAGNVLNVFDNERLFQRPTLFIVHSFGGLIIKHLWRLAHDRDRMDVLQSVRGVIFLATPHSGSGLAEYLKFVLARAPTRPTVTADELQRSAPQLRDLNDWYRNHAIEKNFVYFETQPTGPFGTVVDESSANPGLPEVYPVGLLADHITISKPSARTEQLVKAVNRHIEEVFGGLLVPAGSPATGASAAVADHMSESGGGERPHFPSVKDDFLTRQILPKSDVFLHYSSPDAEWIEALARRLEDERQLKVWLDKWSLVPGESPLSGRKRGFEEAATCVICIGQDTPEEWWCGEVTHALMLQARNEKFRTIPILLPDASDKVPSKLELLSIRTWADFRHGQDQDYAFHVLVQGIRGLPIGRWQPSPVPQIGEMLDPYKRRLIELQALGQYVDKSVEIEYQQKILNQWYEDSRRAPAGNRRQRLEE